jgi:non-heme chloroperoxidase
MLGLRSLIATGACACLVVLPISGLAQTTRFVAVEPEVKLEVLDWGGNGRPVVLLAGLGATAQDFSAFARLLTPTYRVLGVTRRGFGASSAPAHGYSADRLGDDVLAVIDSLGLKFPVLAGHSIAGQELSSIGSRHPERVAGLVYLDAAYSYAFYDRARGDYRVDLDEARRHLAQLDSSSGSEETRRLLDQLLAVDIPALDRALRERLSELPPAPRDPTPASTPRAAVPQTPAAVRAILAGEQRYTSIRAPVLAIFALPKRIPVQVAANAGVKASWLAAQSKLPAQADAFERGVPTARVVRIANADHAVFDSHPSEVLRELRAFIATLPASP